MASKEFKSAIQSVEWSLAQIDRAPKQSVTIQVNKSQRKFELRDHAECVMTCVGLLGCDGGSICDNIGCNRDEVGHKDALASKNLAVYTLTHTQESDIVRRYSNNAKLTRTHKQLSPPGAVSVNFH